jgi:hypothetical protein
MKVSLKCSYELEESNIAFIKSTMVYWLSGKFSNHKLLAMGLRSNRKVLNEMEESNIAFVKPTMVYWLSGIFADIAL